MPPRGLARPKQELRIGGRTLLDRRVEAAILAGLAPVFIAVSPDGSVPSDAQARIVSDEEPKERMASSIRAGVSAAMGCSGVVVLVCDQPAITAGHLRELARGGAEIVAPAYAGRSRVPAYFLESEMPRLPSLHGDEGAHHLIRGARAVPLPGEDLDIDTAENLARVGQIFRDLRTK